VSETVEAVAARAARCYPAFAGLTDKARASLLRELATALEAHRAPLVETADRETALGPQRLSGEIDRTAFQLRAFADYIVNGAHRRTVRQAAVSGPPPLGRPALVRTHVPIGPVVVFAPSNFPFAFSVLGGDTASALAAGNPVIVKEHRGHPELSAAVWEIARDVIWGLGLPEDVLQLVRGASRREGLALVTAPEIAAVGFTGSLAAGRDLLRAISSREAPIPFYGELSSVNPVVGFPGALDADGPDLAAKLAGSITLGSGQFCTSPGILLVLEHPASRRFLDLLADRLRQSPTHPMLTPGIRAQFEERVRHVLANRRVSSETGGASTGTSPLPTLVEVHAEAFLEDPDLREEVFGPFCVAITARDVAGIVEVLDAIGGSLTTTIWANSTDGALARPVVEKALTTAGRVLFAGVPTGVAVTAAQQHGGPWPSSSRPDTTSVGLAAIARFMRPVALQDLPAGLDVLPAGLRDALAEVPEDVVR
jgi:NADP-dependent aldehyde dehydrogenase